MGQRQALERLASALRDANGSGIVIGGASVWTWGRTGRLPNRAVRAVEVVVSDEESARIALRACTDRDALANVAIRTRIAPLEWGLPETAILAAATPLPDRALQGLRRPSPSGALVCALVGASVGGLRGGLEAAWDTWMALRGEALDPDQVLSLVDALQAPRAFWVPARVLTQQVGVPIPREILDGAPRDRRQARLERVAARRLFRSRPASPMAETLFRWAWPALATGTRTGFGQRLPSTAVRAVRELPSAWREIGGSGVSGAIREARRVVATWGSEAR